MEILPWNPAQERHCIWHKQDRVFLCEHAKALEKVPRLRGELSHELHDPKCLDGKKSHERDGQRLDDIQSLPCSFASPQQGDHEGAQDVEWLLFQS